MSRDLTPHQKELLRRYALNGSLRGTAAAMGITVSTVKTQLVLIYARLGVKNLADALAAIEKL